MNQMLIILGVFTLVVIVATIWAISKLSKAEKQLKAEGPKVEYTLDDVVKAAQYGFTYRGESQNDGKEIPVGNVLQWLMHRKSLINVPKEFQDYKSN